MQTAEPTSNREYATQARYFRAKARARVLFAKGYSLRPHEKVGWWVVVKPDGVLYSVEVASGRCDCYQGLHYGVCKHGLAVRLLFGIDKPSWEK